MENKQRKRRPRREFDDQFRLTVLREYYESGKSLNSICKKYQLSSSNVHAWEKKYRDNVVSLPQEIQELTKEVFMAGKSRKSKEVKFQNVPKSHEEEMQEEIIRLRKALEYSELRNEALNELLKIGKERYGIDLLKKAGAKQ